MSKGALLLMATIVLILAEQSLAATLYSTGFENPPFQVGQPLAGQDGWTNQIFNGGPLGPNGSVSAAHANSGLQSVQINGANLTDTGTGVDVGAYRQFVNFDV